MSIERIGGMLTISEAVTIAVPWWRPVSAATKRVIGDALRSRTKSWQTTEVAIAVASLSRMLKPGRPE